MKLVRTTLAITLATALACGCDDDADLVLRNGAIYTLDPARPWAEALAVRDGVLVHVGDEDGAMALAGATTRVVDLGGRMAMPGLHDSHLHLLEANHAAMACALEPGLDPVHHRTRLRRCAQRRRRHRVGARLRPLDPRPPGIPPTPDRRPRRGDPRSPGRLPRGDLALGLDQHRGACGRRGSTEWAIRRAA